ncbi:hypothetical protein DFH27DRAFT_62104 [Peziza echinospora]|nr:hypothetical protein DFH27DRAFT_62104 [Peziza echinospora]
MDNTAIITNYLTSFLDYLPPPLSTLSKSLLSPVLTIVSPTIALAIPIITPMFTVLIRPFITDPTAGQVSSDLINAFLLLLVLYLSLSLLSFFSRWMYGLVVMFMRIVIFLGIGMFLMHVWVNGLDVTVRRIWALIESLSGGPLEEMLYRFLKMEKEKPYMFGFKRGTIPRHWARAKRMLGTAFDDILDLRDLHRAIRKLVRLAR